MVSQYAEYGSGRSSKSRHCLANRRLRRLQEGAHLHGLRPQAANVSRSLSRSVGMSVRRPARPWAGLRVGQ